MGKIRPTLNLSWHYWNCATYFAASFKGLKLELITLYNYFTNFCYFFYKSSKRLDNSKNKER